MKFVNADAGVFLHRICKRYSKEFRMSNCNLAITPMEIGAKLSKETNDEHVDATLYKSQCLII